MIGEKIRQLRKQKHITQKDLAQLLKVSPGAVGLWETNKRIPDYDTIIKISEIFKISTDYLLKETFNNEIIILGRNGLHKKFELDEKSLKIIENLANSLVEQEHSYDSN